MSTNGPSTVKRTRRTKAEMNRLRDAIYHYAQANQRCTIRQIYYLGIGSYWPKDEGGSRKHYRTVVRLAGEMREEDRLPWEWIADATRWVRRDDMHLSGEDAMTEFARSYRRDLWANQQHHVEVWCESDSIASVLSPVTYPAGVSLYVCRGQSSKAYVREATIAYMQRDKPVSILFVGDWDPSGLAIQQAVEDRVERYSDSALEVAFERIAIQPGDIPGLVSHPVNKRDPNYRRFVERCRLMDLDPQAAVEVEALDPNVLRFRLEAAINSHIEDLRAWNSLYAAEQSERELFLELRDMAQDDFDALEVA